VPFDKQLTSHISHHNASRICASDARGLWLTVRLWPAAGIHLQPTTHPAAPEPTVTQHTGSPFESVQYVGLPARFPVGGWSQVCKL